MRDEEGGDRCSQRRSDVASFKFVNLTLLGIKSAFFPHLNSCDVGHEK